MKPKQDQLKDHIEFLHGRIAVLEDALTQSVGLLDAQSSDLFRQYIEGKSPSDYTGLLALPVNMQNGAALQLSSIKGRPYG